MSDKNYAFVKLVSGESLLAEVINQKPSAVVVLRLPLQVFIDRGQLVMFPFLPIHSTDDREIKILREHILFQCSLIQSISVVLDQYAEKAYEPKEIKPENKEPKEASGSPDEMADIFQRLNEEINKGKKPS